MAKGLDALHAGGQEFESPWLHSQKNPVQHWHLSGPHGPFFDVKSLNITFDAQNDAQNSGVRALSASAKNALCIRLNDRGISAAPLKDL